MAVDGPVPGDIRQSDHRIDLGKKVMKQKKMCSNKAHWRVGLRFLASANGFVAF